MSATATVSLMIALVGGSLSSGRAAAAAVVEVARVPVRGCRTAVPDLSLAGLNTGAGMALSASFHLGGIWAIVRGVLWIWQGLKRHRLGFEVMDRCLVSLEGGVLGGFVWVRLGENFSLSEQGV